jgi:hypothetical protein
LGHPRYSTRLFTIVPQAGVSRNGTFPGHDVADDTHAMEQLFRKNGARLIQKIAAGPGHDPGRSIL